MPWIIFHVLAFLMALILAAVGGFFIGMLGAAGGLSEDRLYSLAYVFGMMGMVPSSYFSFRWVVQHHFLQNK